MVTQFFSPLYHVSCFYLISQVQFSVMADTSVLLQGTASSGAPKGEGLWGWNPPAN